VRRGGGQQRLLPAHRAAAGVALPPPSPLFRKIEIEAV
jgi:hypothetical protein